MYQHQFFCCFTATALILNARLESVGSSPEHIAAEIKFETTKLAS